MSKLSMIEFYTAMLCSAGLIVTPDGMVSLDDGSGSAIPLTINNAVMFLPTPELLQSGNINGKIIFHPVWESAVRKDSIIFKRLSEVFRLRAQHVLGSLMENLMMIAAEHDKHQLLSPEQSRFLSILPNADAKSRAAIKKVMDSLGPKSGKKLVTFFLKKNGVYKGAECRRLAKVSFPLMDERGSADSHLFGISASCMTVGRKKEILDLLEFILPGILNDEYSYGTNELMAPNLRAICGAYFNIMSALNNVVNAYRDVLTDAHTLVTKLDWYDSVDQFNAYKNAAPLFPGNEGDLADGAAAPTEAAAVAQGLQQVNVQQTNQRPIDKSKFYTPLDTGNKTGLDQNRPSVSGGVNALPKWVDLAKQAVNEGRLAPGNRMEDVMLNNPGATGVVMVDSNTGAILGNANPNAIAQQQQQQQLVMMAKQVWANLAMQNGINVNSMTPEMQHSKFLEWYQLGGNVIVQQVMQQQQQNVNHMGFNSMQPMQMNNSFMNTNINNPQTMNGFGLQNNSPFSLPGRNQARAIQGQTQMTQGFNQFNGNLSQPLVKLF
jgi:hypothetical protein